MGDTGRVVGVGSEEAAASCVVCAVSRRTALIGVGAGVAGLLAACGDDEPAAGADDASSSPAADPGDSDTGEPSPTEESTSPTEPTPEETTGGGAAALASVSDVPVGGGIILDGAGVVITQPSEGEFLAFSTTCTHQGCAVTEVADGLITCPCHDSRYSVADGSVQQGPAERPLEEVAIAVEGDQILPG